MSRDKLTVFQIVQLSGINSGFYAYQKDTHQYHDSYVNKQSWRVAADAREALRAAGTRIPFIFKKPRIDNLTEARMKFDGGILDRGEEPVVPDLPQPEFEVPEDIVSYKWRVTQVSGGNFSSPEVVQTADEGLQMGLFFIELPQEGRYEFTLEILFSDETTVRNTKIFRLKDSLIVSIGDSYASGEGNPDVPGRPAGFDPSFSWGDLFPPLALWELTTEFWDWATDRLMENYPTFAKLVEDLDDDIDMDPEPVWLEPKAHRSMYSSHTMAAKMIQESIGNYVTYLSFARSGAEISDLLGPKLNENGQPHPDNWINMGQIEEISNAVGNREIDALIISISGNDVGFSGSVSTMVKGDLKSLLPGANNSDADVRNQVERSVRDKIATLRPKFDDLKAQIDTLNVKKVYLVEYPASHFQKTVNGEVINAAGCELFASRADMDITPADARVFNELSIDLNTKLNEIAADFGWVYVDGIVEDFEGKGYCLPSHESLYVTASRSLAIQGDIKGTLHPNERGHKLTAERIKEKVLRFSFKPKPLFKAQTLKRVRAVR